MKNVRQEATNATIATLLADISDGGDGPPARSTIHAYLDELARMFAIEPLPAWSAHLRSSPRLRRSAERYFADPALAVAALRGLPARLIVVTAFGHGYQTDDGIAVAPLTALKP